MIRTGAVLAAWYLWPQHRYVVIPAVIAVLYLIAIIILVTRSRDAATLEAGRSGSLAPGAN
ncbi:MAG: hypothetical protein WDM77_03600 [Steroidobacteraceae bacterium]